MCNACYIARMSGRPPFPPPTQSPVTSPTYFPFGNTTGTPYPFPAFTSYETHPGQMMLQEGSPPFGLGGHQVPSPVWPNLQYYADSSNYQNGDGKYNPQVQDVGRIGVGRDFNMGPTMGNNNVFRL